MSDLFQSDLSTRIPLNVGLMSVWLHSERSPSVIECEVRSESHFSTRIGHLENELNIIVNGVMRVTLRVIVLTDVPENVLEVSYQ